MHKLEKTDEGANLSRNGSKDYRPGVWFQGATVPGSAAQVRACDNRREGTAERKKQRKLGAKVDNGAKIEYSNIVSSNII